MATFQSLGISEPFLQALTQSNLSEPSRIQSEAYPILSSGRDAWLSAPTGSGKTLAYLLPLLEKIDTSAKALQVVILSPTQELAVQIIEVVRLLNEKGSLGIRSQLLIGNASSKRQKENLKKKKPHVVAGSTGRMVELVRAGALKLHQVLAVSLDETDILLSIDHIGNVQELLKRMPRDRQVVFSSATDKGAAFSEAQQIGSDVAWIDGKGTSNESTIEHFYIESNYHHRPDTLRKLLRTIKPSRALIFTHRNTAAKELGKGFDRFEIPHAVLHGEMSKFQREAALKDFRSGTVPYLISSDVSARGLDVQEVSHVINFDMPTLSDDYLHRVGRTGRMGAKGTAISIVASDETRLIDRYVKDLDIQVTRAKLQGGEFDVAPDRQQES